MGDSAGKDTRDVGLRLADSVAAKGVNFDLVLDYLMHPRKMQGAFKSDQKHLDTDGDGFVTKDEAVKVATDTALHVRPRALASAVVISHDFLKDLSPQGDKPFWKQGGVTSKGLDNLVRLTDPKFKEDSILDLNKYALPIVAAGAAAVVGFAMMRYGRYLSAAQKVGGLAHTIETLGKCSKIGSFAREAETIVHFTKMDSLAHKVGAFGLFSMAGGAIAHMLGTSVAEQPKKSADFDRRNQDYFSLIDDFQKRNHRSSKDDYGMLARR